RQSLDQRRRRQTLRDDEVVALAQAQAVLGQRDYAEHVVAHLQRRIGRPVDVAPVLAELPLGDAAGARHLERQQAMRGQLVERARLAAPAQVVGRCDHAQRRVFELARGQPAVGQRAQAHGQVEALGDQVDVAVGDVELDPHPRIALGEAPQQRRQTVVAVGGRHAQAHAAVEFAALALDRALGLVDLGERGARLLQ
ncbi:hypothetical protein CATMIT_01620, partial [Catenibacterium mitsuokai DSM 15897]